MDIDADMDIQLNHFLRAISTFLLCGVFFVSLAMACDKCNNMLNEDNDAYESVSDENKID